MESVDGEHLLIREDPGAIADAVIDLWHHPALRENLCTKALELVRARYSWSAAAQRIAQSLRQDLALHPYRNLVGLTTPSL